MFEGSMMSTGWGYVGSSEKGFEWLFTPDTSDPTYWYVYAPKLNNYGYVNKDYLY